MVTMYYTPVQRFWWFIYWLLLVISFCAIGFWLVATAQGYRYNSPAGRWQKTGMIIAKSDPRDAVLSFSNRQFRLDQTNRIPNILPGTYRLQIVKNGYLPWEKTVTVEPGFVVGLDEIVLFLDQPIAVANAAEYEALLPFYNVPDDRLTIIDGELRQGTTLISRFVDPPTTARLLATNRHIVYLQHSQLRLIEIDGQHDQLLFEGRTLDPALLVVFEDNLIGIRDQEALTVLKIR